MPVAAQEALIFNFYLAGIINSCGWNTTELPILDLHSGTHTNHIT
jgi:hypothetical protein